MGETNFSIKQLLYINLDFRTDRLHHMQTMLAACPWPVARVSAERIVSEEEAQGQKATSLGALSIWMSHKKALLQGLEVIGDGSLAVLEDDVVVESEAYTVLDEKMNALPSTWEVLMLSPRYREATVLENGVRKRPKWEHVPFGFRPVHIRSAIRRRKLICNGAHFCVYRNASAIEKIVRKMDSVMVKYDYDKFCGESFETYGMHTKAVHVGRFGSNHNVPQDGGS